jgi:hypothetical protein
MRPKCPREWIALIIAIVSFVLIVFFVQHEPTCPEAAHFVQGGVALSKAKCE